MVLGRTELLGVCYFHSNTVPHVVPNVIPKNTYYIEVITDGEILFDDEKDRRVYGKGTIFWHKGGEETIWRLTPVGYFVAFAVRFRIIDYFERPSHISRWDNLLELDEFVIETMRNTFDDNIDNGILANYLINRFYWEAYSSKVIDRTNDLPLALNKVVTILKSENSASLSVNDLSKLSGVSTPHLFALFRKHLNSTPHQYLLNLRIKRARVMLASTNDSVKEIADKCGFSSIESFYRLFRQYNHLPPSQFRDRHTALKQADLTKKTPQSSK